VSRARRTDGLVGATVALVAFLPFLRGTLAGASLYFRDLAVGFFPQRQLALDGLLGGAVPVWNPFVHEGVPLSLPAVGYLPDLLQLLRPDPVGISAVLALHVPLAAVSLYALARRQLELPPVGAAAGALVYALGGFVLSTVNLYVMVQAAAWAPLVVLALGELLSRGGRRALAFAAVALALTISTTGVEIAAQAVVVGTVLGLRGGTGLRTATSRLAAALALGAAVAAPVLALVAAQVGSSARGAGLPAEVVLAHSVHPFTLLQTLVGGLYGNLANLAGEWWGQNFFTRGFPYILSLYLGAPAIALAVVGARGRHPLRVPLLALCAVALVVSLGRYAGFLPLVEAVPALRLFRYPVKAFFTVHLSVSLLVALGAAELAAAEPRRNLGRLLVAGSSLGGLLLALAALPFVVPSPAAAFSAAFFPPGLAPAVRQALLARIAADAATGGLLALTLGGVAALGRAGVVPPGRAIALVLALLAGDLLRTGSGLNPMVAGSFFAPSPPLRERLADLHERRVFSCPFDQSPSYLEARRAIGSRHELWTFAVALETLTPALNVPLRVPTAMSPDLTMLVPETRVLPAGDRACHDLDALVPRLRAAAVDTVLSLDPLDHPELLPDDTWRPTRIAPLAVHAYRLHSPLPRVQLIPEGSDPGVGPETGATAGRPGAVHASFAGSAVRLEVQTDREATVVVRDGWAAGWRADVDGRPVPVERVDSRHRGVLVPPGRSEVRMRYWPRLLGPSLVLCALALGLALFLGRGARPRAAEGPPRA